MAITIIPNVGAFIYIASSELVSDFWLEIGIQGRGQDSAGAIGSGLDRLGRDTQDFSRFLLTETFERGEHQRLLKQRRQPRYRVVKPHRLLQPDHLIFGPRGRVLLIGGFGVVQTTSPEKKPAKSHATPTVPGLVDGDGAQPGQKRPISVVPLQGSPGGDEGLMSRLVGFVRVARVSSQQTVKGLLVAADEIGERPLVPRRRAKSEDRIGGTLFQDQAPSAVSDFTTVSSNTAACSGVSTDRMAMTWIIVSFCKASIAR